ncbi:hypothetical protein Bandiella_00399 [Candidatus Bandiella woodruffii]|uniref:Uncharacterized protein n=1 Tax=Candidatus Bandiella euplotis TaxID=1664265 RepID=A0ABZ0UQJ1_9RICK|nr:hypothetical protein Bandiella_00399 [Candidatus Bandiella woodruffii]
MSKLTSKERFDKLNHKVSDRDRLMVNKNRVLAKDRYKIALLT